MLPFPIIFVITIVGFYTVYIVLDALVSIKKNININIKTSLSSYIEKSNNNEL